MNKENRDRIFLSMFFLFIVLLGGGITIHIAMGGMCAMLCFALFFYRTEVSRYLSDNKLERYYLFGLLGFFCYALILTVVFLLLPNPLHLKPSYTSIERTLFAYVIPPLLALFVSLKLSIQQLNKAIIVFVISATCGGLLVLFAYQDIALLISNPLHFISNSIALRVTGGESSCAFVNIFTKDYSFFLSLAAIFSFMYVCVWKKRYSPIFISLFLINAIILLLTVNRDAMFGVFFAIVFVGAYSFPKLPSSNKILLGLLFIGLLAAIYIATPKNIVNRFAEINTESRLFLKEGHDIGSVSIRLTIWKTLFKHLPDFWLFGAGPTYTHQKLQLYLKEEGYSGHPEYPEYTHHHNDYLFHWHNYGIIGLLFVLFMFGYPLYIMLKRRKISVMLCALIIFYLTVLMVDAYLRRVTQQTLLFWLYLAVFMLPKGVALINSNHRKRA